MMKLVSTTPEIRLNILNLYQKTTITKIKAQTPKRSLVLVWNQKYI